MKPAPSGGRGRAIGIPLGLAVLALSLPPIVVRSAENASVSGLLVVRFATQIAGLLIVRSATASPGRGNSSRQERSCISLIGGLFFALYLALFFTAVRETSVDRAVVLAASVYLVIFALRDLTAASSSTLRVVAGTVAIVAALAIQVDFGLSSLGRAEGLAVTASLCFGVYIHLSERVLSSGDVGAAIEHQLGVSRSGLVAASGYVLFVGSAPRDVLADALASGVLLGLLAGFGHLMLSVTQGKSGPLQAAATASGSPALAAVLAALAFHRERLGQASFGAVLAGVGLWLLVRGRGSGSRGEHGGPS